MYSGESRLMTPSLSIKTTGPGDLFGDNEGTLKPLLYQNIFVFLSLL